MWPVLGLILLVIVANGCSNRRIVYPGDGSLVIVDIDADVDRTPVTVQGSANQTVGDAIRKAIRYWDQAGARLRTVDQLTDTDASSVPDAVHLTVTSQLDEAAIEKGFDAFYNYDTGNIQLFLQRWATTDLTTRQWYWLVVTIAHEAGHAIGLDHVTDVNAVMYPDDTNFNSRANLAPADMTEYARVWGAKQQ